VTAPLGRLGIWSIELRTGAEDETRETAAQLEALGWPALWIPGLSGTDGLVAAERLLAATTRTTVATGVLGQWNHTPAELTATHHDLQQRYGARLLTGIGVSNADSARKAGQDFPGPVSAMAAYLDQLDQQTEPIARDERILGAMGPRMSRLAADRSRGLHPFLVSPEYTHSTRAALGPSPLIAPHQAVVLETDPARARAAARDGIGMFIGFPSYQANLRRLGFTDADLVPGGSDRLIDSVVAWGDLDAVAARLGEHHAAGADHVALHVLTSEGGPSLDQSWRELASLL
jgi:probable F420-dependent oxidoreductase